MHSRLFPQDEAGLFAEPLFLTRGSPTARQRSRYLSIVQATLDCLRRKGFEQTKVQDIASKSRVSLATIYRYFKSRDKLIYVATVYWATQVTLPLIPRRNACSAEVRMFKFIRAAHKKLFEEPRLLEALARANLSTAPEVVALLRKKRMTYWLTTFSAEYTHDPVLLDDLNLIFDRVWFAGLTRWAIGQRDFDEVTADCEWATGIVLNAHRLSSNLQSRSGSGGLTAMPRNRKSRSEMATYNQVTFLRSSVAKDCTAPGMKYGKNRNAKPSP